MSQFNWQRIAGSALIAAALAPAATRLLKSVGAFRRAIDMRMTLVIERPLPDVFDFCRDFENFPNLIDVLLSVEDTQDGRSHWAVRSPSGAKIEWDATVTKYVPNSVIAWENVPGSAVRATGLMRFAPLSPDDTRVDLTITYVPAYTSLGDALRAIVEPTNTQRLTRELRIASEQLAKRSSHRMSLPPDLVPEHPESIDTANDAPQAAVPG